MYSNNNLISAKDYFLAQLFYTLFEVVKDRFYVSF